ncbi:hypothetical protein [Roseibium sp. M-1]
MSNAGGFEYETYDGEPRFLSDIYIGVDGTGYESAIIQALKGIQGHGADHPGLRRSGVRKMESLAVGNKRAVAQMHQSPGYFQELDIRNKGLGMPRNHLDEGRGNLYKEEFRFSFVRRYYDSWKNNRRYYRRGPEMEGLSTNARIQDAYDWYQETVKYRTGRIFLCGYSRGAYIVVQLARRLQKEGVEIHCMMLFDAVSRVASDLIRSKIVNSFEPSEAFKIAFGDETSYPVPSNVRNCMHVHRNMKVSRSREFMGNCAMVAELRNKVNFELVPFTATHSALGGLPYEAANGRSPSEKIIETGETKPCNVTFRQDGEAARNIRSTMDAFLHRMAR